jgi:hypothetical protein
VKPIEIVLVGFIALVIIGFVYDRNSPHGFTPTPATSSSVGR